jgi:inner membrane protein
VTEWHDTLLLRLSAIAALAAVLVLDAVVPDTSSLLVFGLFDEMGHLATAWVLLVAFLPTRCRSLAPWALSGAVLIDVDHIPLYLWDVGTAAGTPGRPVSHSLIVVLLLLVVSRLHRRLRTPFTGLGLGVALHLVRDVVTGPGAPLLWPISTAGVRAAYPLYVGLLCLAAAWAALRPVQRQRPSRRTPAEDVAGGVEK